VVSELKWDPKPTTSADIAVAVKEGVVTLSGFVHAYFEKDAAEKAAKRVYGVKAVANNIEVRSIGTRTDPEIAREVGAGNPKPCKPARREDPSDGGPRAGESGRQRGLAVPEDARRIRSEKTQGRYRRDQQYRGETGCYSD